MAYSAKHIRQREQQGQDGDMEREEEHVSGIRSLSEESRDMRNAGRKLETSGSGDSDVLAAIVKLRETVEKQAAGNERIAKQMQDTLAQMMDIADEIKRIRDDEQDESRSAQQMALRGVNRAQAEAEKITLRNIDEVTEKSKEYIDSMVQQSKKRIKRLAMITLPDRLFYFGKWVALILALFILTHVVFQMLV